jgi:uncharacterized RDD family membrane protein YckC
MRLIILYRPNAEKTMLQLHEYLANHEIVHDLKALTMPIEQAVVACHAVFILVTQGWSNDGWLEDSTNLDMLALQMAIELKKAIVPIFMDEAAVNEFNNLPKGLAILKSQRGVFVKYPKDGFSDLANHLADVIELNRLSAPPPVPNFHPDIQPAPFLNPRNPKGIVRPLNAASMDRRQVSFLLDFIVTFSPFLLLFVIGKNGKSNTLDLAILAGCLVFYVVYQGYWLSQRNGQTLAKRLLGLRLVKMDGSALTWQTAILRSTVGYAVTLVSFALAGASVRAVLQGGDNGFLPHDRRFGTMVIDTRKKIDTLG